MGIDMGHYDDEIEAEENRHRLARRKRDIEALIKMDNALDLMGSAVFNFDDKKMKETLRTMHEQYVLWQYSNDLLVRDPEIIMDILKDDK